jgi:hypothetical protein
MKLPPEIERVRSAGEILAGAGHPVGRRMLDWIEANCPTEGRDFFGLAVTGRTWETEAKAARRDDLLKRAADLLIPTVDIDDRARRMRKHFRRYRETVWPTVRAEEDCPSDHDEFDRLLWQALKLNPHDVRTEHFRQILSE